MRKNNKFHALSFEVVLFNLWLLEYSLLVLFLSSLEKPMKGSNVLDLILIEVS